MTAQETDRIECAIRHIQTAVDVDPWAVAIAVEAMKTQLSAEGTTSDLISRQAAIDVLGVFTQADALGHTPKQIVEALPSAHPEIEERKAESAQNVPKEDLISRKAAIDALKNERSDWNCDYNVPVDHCIDAIYSVPSAQPEPQWIPVSERLPEEGQSILVTADGWRMVAIIRTFFKDMHKDIIAWMPLPEPYRVERRTDDANDIT